MGHSLTVELRTLTPSVLVRIQLPQPRIQPALCGFIYWSEVMVRQCNDCCFGSTMSRFDKPAQSNRHECPAGHIFIYARGNQLRPTKNSTRLVRVFVWFLIFSASSKVEYKKVVKNYHFRTVFVDQH